MLKNNTPDMTAGTEAVDEWIKSDENHNFQVHFKNIFWDYIFIIPAVRNLKCKSHWINQYVASSFVQWEHSEAFWFTSSFQNSVWPTGTSEERPRPLRNGEEENSADFSHMKYAISLVFFYFLMNLFESAPYGPNVFGLFEFPKWSVLQYVKKKKKMIVH